MEQMPRLSQLWWISFMAFISGLKALRYKLSGSVFIKKICDVIKELGNEDDMLTMTTEVNFSFPCNHLKV